MIKMSIVKFSLITSFLKIYEKIFCLLKVTEKFFAIRRLVLSGGPNSQLSSLLSAFVNFHIAVLCCEDLSCAIIIYCPKKIAITLTTFTHLISSQYQTQF